MSNFWRFFDGVFNRESLVFLPVVLRGKIAVFSRSSLTGSSWEAALNTPSFTPGSVIPVAICRPINHTGKIFLVYFYIGKRVYE